MSKRVAGVILAAVLSGAAWGADDDPQHWCRNGAFSEEGNDFALYRLKDASTVFLRDPYSFNPHCPNPAIAECRENKVLALNSVVIANKVVDGFICAFSGNDAGFLPLSAVEKLPAQPSRSPALSAWAGRWGTPDESVTITVTGNVLQASGKAYWPGKNYTPPASGGPSRHDGSFKLSARPQGNQIEFADNDRICVLQATLFGDALILHDNAGCGGMNVRFSGVLYRAKPPRRIQ
jgi:hypothetical protein